jgi:carbonic anhydrase/acetyltransferase-like protein (isoleucine patch superfamily)
MTPHHPAFPKQGDNGCFRIMIRSFQGKSPQIAPSVWIDPTAVLIGDVTIGERSSIWPNAVLRGDVHKITIGEETNIQDGSVLHVEENLFSLTIGNRVTVGHSVCLHGCVVEDDSLIGIGAIVLNGARIGAGSVIAAGALVPEGMDIPPGSLAMGVPAKVRRSVSPEEQERFRLNAQHYVDLRAKYLDGQSNA